MPSPEFVLLEMAADMEEIPEDTGRVYEECGPESTVIAEMFGQDTAGQDAETETGIPGRQDGRIGRAALIVLGKVDEHVLESRIHVAVAESDNECRQIVAYGVMDGSEHQIAAHGCDSADGCVVSDPVFPQGLGPGKPRQYEAYGEKREEKAGAARNAEFFLAIKRKKSKLLIPGDEDDEFFAVSEASRCTECSYLCLKCVEVCPNRANVAIDMRDTGLFEDPYQILHLDAYCNECGNCATFCPHSGRPYKDKLTLFSLREDFDSSDNSGFYVENDTVLIRLDGKVIEGVIDREGMLEADVPEEVKAMIEKVLLSYSYLLGAVEE